MQSNSVQLNQLIQPNQLNQHNLTKSTNNKHNEKKNCCRKLENEP